MTGRLEEKRKLSIRKNTCKGRKRVCRADLMNCSQLSMPGVLIHVREQKLGKLKRKIWPNERRLFVPC